MHRRLVGTFTCNLCVPQSSARFDIDPSHNSQNDPVHKVVFCNRDLHYCHCDEGTKKSFVAFMLAEWEWRRKRCCATIREWCNAKGTWSVNINIYDILNGAQKCFSAWKRQFEREIAQCDSGRRKKIFFLPFKLVNYSWNIFFCHCSKRHRWVGEK